ncbi:MAG: glycosyltransferase N-terminal domain-containing protein [Flavobacteriaceae bacterium]|nr:glycosyltransferase N-terminal domain-containing protein [Flavobacteriaceae bacterium]
MRNLYSIVVRLVRRILIVAPISGKPKQFVDGRKRIWDDLKTIPSDREVIWMHCASLGEYEQGLPVLKALKTKNPQAFYLVSFFSPSGYLVKKTHQVADLTTYLPWDIRTDVRRFVKKVQPTKVFFVKYEFWPNLLIELQKQRIPTYLIAGLFQPQQLFFKPWGGWYRKLLKGYAHLFVQNEASQNLLLRIGIKQVSVSGDTRFDRDNLSNEKLPFMAKFVMNRQCIIAGSVWPEDLSVLKESIANTPAQWCWLIVPHEVDEKAVKTLLDELPAQSQRYSTIDHRALAQATVLVLDTVGLLSSCYQYAQIAYVGGGMGTKGLHNILEPAATGIPIVIGKNYASFPEAVQLVNTGGVISISNASEAKEKILSLIHDRKQRQETGKINLHFIRASQGATTKIMDTLL